MNGRLKDRLKQGVRGGLPLTDSHKAIHQDSLTVILRLEEELEARATFAEFIRGYVDSTDFDLPESHRKSLEKALRDMDKNLGGKGG